MKSIAFLLLLLLFSCGGIDGPRAFLLPDGTIGSIITYRTGTGDMGMPAIDEVSRVIRLNDYCKPDESTKFIAVEAFPTGAGREISAVFKCEKNS